MATKLEQYKQQTSVMVEAPSGFTFTARGLTPAEAMAIIGGLPSLAEKAKKFEDMTAQDHLDALQREADVTKNLILTVVPEVTEDGANDTLPYNQLSMADVKFLTKLINDLSGLNGPEAATARRLLREPK